MSEKRVFKVGSRKSQLALIQTELVIGRLKEQFPEKKFEIVKMLTTGDKILDKPLPKIGEKSLFTRELETALEKNEVDFVVHSLKDLPTTLPSGLTIGAVLEREDPRDALIVRKNLGFKNLKSLPKSSTVGTSSLRRCAQLSRNYPDILVESVRGNLNTRLKKLDEDTKYTAIILAAAGVKRMKLENRITQLLEPTEFLYAVGQGALAVECCSGNDDVLDILQSLNHHSTILRVVAERSFLKALGGGCSAPVAVCTTLKGESLSIVGAVWSLDGSKLLKKSKSVTFECGSGEPARVLGPWLAFHQSNLEDLLEALQVQFAQVLPLVMAKINLRRHLYSAKTHGPEQTDGLWRYCSQVFGLEVFSATADLGNSCSVIYVCRQNQEIPGEIVFYPFSCDNFNENYQPQDFVLNRKTPHLEPKAHVGITAKNVPIEDLEAADALGLKLAEELIKDGALEVINEAKSTNEKHENVAPVKNGAPNSCLAENEASVS